MYQLKILPEAINDIKESAIWYNKQQKGLGLKFTKKVRTKMYFVQKKPLYFPKRYNQTRTAIVDNFPFMIHYEIIKQTILVKAVFHTSLSPKRWTNR